MNDFTNKTDAQLVAFWNDGDGALSWVAALEAELQSRGYITRSSDSGDGLPRVGGERLLLTVKQRSSPRSS